MRNEDMLIEIGTEELPPKLLKSLIAGLGENIRRELAENGFGFKNIETHGTARRMAAIIRSLEERQADKESEKRGPPVEMAYNRDGEATPALNGFLRACGISDVSLLQRSRNRKGEWLVYREHQKGRKIAEEIQGIVDRSIEGLNVARPMRWSNLREEFVRPVHWVVVLFGSEVLELEVFGCTASNLSYGHRFMHPDPIAIRSAKEYEKQCRDGKVLVDPIEREKLIREKVKEEGKRLGGEIEIDDQLLEEVSALVEWPAVLSGTFDEEFLGLPENVLISVMKKHQRYFHLRGADGKLLAKFITVANIVSKKPQVVIRGNERVIKPRLRDAQFFFVNDTKTRLEEKLSLLEQITFQTELGSYREKAERISKLAGYIAEKVGCDKKNAERAGLLCKVDLVTNMVEEFPDLQGQMGGHYAAIDGERPEICSAIKDHYKPGGPRDTIPGKGIDSSVAIADKLDTLVGIFGVGGGPTGSKDPYALRRQTLGVIRIVLDHKLDINIKECLAEAMENLRGTTGGAGQYHFDITKVHSYIVDRLMRFYQEMGIESDVVRAVQGQAGGIVNLYKADEAIRAIQEFKAKDKGREVIALSKRVANIISGHGEKELPEIKAELYEHKAERMLQQGMEDAEHKLRKAKSTEERLEVLGAQGPMIADYFDSVLVMDDDKDKRLNRLAAIARMNKIFAEVADFKVLTVT